MDNGQATSYDEVPYESNPFPQSHPDHLAAIATLFGMRPAGVDGCRVLELGCAAGGNLIPMAYHLPNSRFFGIDLSGRQIADGQQLIQALGLSNIELRHLSILDVDQSLGEFDYILSHGTYSWVPPEVQEKILAISRENLAPQGVAYVSYNTYPGWHMRGLIRDMMCYHVRRFSQPLVRARQARALLDFLAKAAIGEKNPYGLLLKSEVEVVREKPDSYLLHEHLEEFNEPIYFHQFVERAARHGLQYLGESELGAMMTGTFPQAVAQTLKRVAVDSVQMEQFMDFLHNRMFRQTLLCHQGIPLTRTLDPVKLAAFHVASPARPASVQPELHSEKAEEFRAPNLHALSSQVPLVKAAMVHLAEIWPEAMPFPQLLNAARARLEQGADAPRSPGSEPAGAPWSPDADTLAANLLKCFSYKLVHLYLHPPVCVRTISERPAASSLARIQAVAGRKVVNQHHESITLDEFNCHLVQLLDGTRDQQALLGALTQRVVSGKLKMFRDGQPVTDADQARLPLQGTIGECLPKLAHHALLVA
jgi:methyltransferase-like protein/SAM-dependent methyltransferase